MNEMRDETLGMSKQPAQSWTPTMPNMKKTKKQRRSTLPSMGRVSNSSITKILMPFREKNVNILMSRICFKMNPLGIRLIALRGLSTRTVLIAERFNFSTSRQYSRALGRKRTRLRKWSAEREVPFWNVLVLYGHCPNSFRAPPPSVKRANVEKKCP